MKLTVACGIAVALCLISLAARSSMLARARAAEAARIASVTPAMASENVALAGLDTRLKSRMQRLARK